MTITPWIINVSRADVVNGNHLDPGEGGVLIQITDPDLEHPVPNHKFSQVHQFKFLDIEQDGNIRLGSYRETLDDAAMFAITQDQADQLVEILQNALKTKSNVVVHCQAGVCRSGAVCEIGVMLGFEDREYFRAPNLLVKYKMMKKLGWLYPEQQLQHTINGNPVQ